MLIFVDQLDAIIKVAKEIKGGGVEPVVIKGERVDFVWPPQPPSLPLDLLRFMPRGSYVIIRGNTITIVP